MLKLMLLICRTLLIAVPFTLNLVKESWQKRKCPDGQANHECLTTLFIQHPIHHWQAHRGRMRVHTVRSHGIFLHVFCCEFVMKQPDLKC